MIAVLLVCSQTLVKKNWWRKNYRESFRWNNSSGCMWASWSEHKKLNGWTLKKKQIKCKRKRTITHGSGNSENVDEVKLKENKCKQKTYAWNKVDSMLPNESEKNVTSGRGSTWVSNKISVWNVLTQYEMYWLRTNEYPCSRNSEICSTKEW